MRTFWSRLWKTPRERAEKVLAAIDGVRAKADAVTQWWQNLQKATLDAEQSAYALCDVKALEEAARQRALFEAANGAFMVRHSSLNNMAAVEAGRHKAEVVDILAQADEDLLKKMNEIRAAHAAELSAAGAQGVTGEPPLITAMERTRASLTSYAHQARNGQDLEPALRWLLENCRA